jgi:hypothetical protein
VRFTLPRLAFSVMAVTDSGTQAFRPVLDTVVLRPDEEQFEMTYRTAVPLSRTADRVREVLVHEKAVR